MISFEVGEWLLSEQKETHEPIRYGLLKLEDSPGLFITGREDNTRPEKFLTSARNICSREVELGRKNMQIQTRFILRLGLQHAVYPFSSGDMDNRARFPPL